MRRRYRRWRCACRTLVLQHRRLDAQQGAAPEASSVQGAVADAAGGCAQLGRSSTISAPCPPSCARACAKAITSVLLHQPAAHLALEHRLAPGRAIALAVHRRARSAGRRAPHRAGRRTSCSRASSRRSAVQIELRLDGPDAAAQLAHHLRPDAAAAKRQRLVGVEQRFDVELVGDRFGQHRGFVTLALARHRVQAAAAAWPAQLRHRAQRHHRPRR